MGPTSLNGVEISTMLGFDAMIAWTYGATSPPAVVGKLVWLYTTCAPRCVNSVWYCAEPTLPAALFSDCTATFTCEAGRPLALMMASARLPWIAACETCCGVAALPSRQPSHPKPHRVPQKPGRNPQP